LLDEDRIVGECTTDLRDQSLQDHSAGINDRRAIPCGTRVSSMEILQSQAAATNRQAAGQSLALGRAEPIVGAHIQ
jgi:hypothetical protein